MKDHKLAAPSELIPWPHCPECGAMFQEGGFKSECRGTWQWRPPADKPQSYEAQTAVLTVEEQLNLTPSYGFDLNRDHESWQRAMERAIKSALRSKGVPIDALGVTIEWWDAPDGRHFRWWETAKEEQNRPLG